jgi:hypothetical protein
MKLHYTCFPGQPQRFILIRNVAHCLVELFQIQLYNIHVCFVGSFYPDMLQIHFSLSM